MTSTRHHGVAHPWRSSTSTSHGRLGGVSVFVFWLGVVFFSVWDVFVVMSKQAGRRLHRGVAPVVKKSERTDK